MNSNITSVITVLLLTVLLCVLLSLPVMLLWNYCLVPAVTGVNEIGLLQALGLSMLSALLFKTKVTKGS
jgi:hypothetical protein